MGKAHDSARRKGREAYLAGLGRDACPYDRYAQVRNIPTGERGFAKAWLDGYDTACAENGTKVISPKLASGK